MSNTDMIFRVDKTDLKSMDVQLEKSWNKFWSKTIENQNKSRGHMSNKDKNFRADKTDLLKSMDVQLEKSWNKFWSKSIENQNKSGEVWEIDFSKLKIQCFVAQGQNRRVFQGTYDTHNVAVKLLHWGEDGISTSDNMALRASYKQEIDVWHNLDHPNITRFVGASVGTSQLKIPSKNPSEGYTNLPPRACCIVEEYLSGGTLKKFLYENRTTKLPFKIVIQLALDLARGLSYLHSKKIVHRNVKAANMLLDSNKNLKIAHFRAARVEAQNPQDMTGTTGTPGYMAPEVIVGKPYNRKCDVYSFGICLWEIYCCDLTPYTAVVEQNLRPGIPQCCPSSLAKIMKKCWDANPEKRPEMDEVVRLLEAIDTSKGAGMIPEDQARGCSCFTLSRRGP